MTFRYSLLRIYTSLFTLIVNAPHAAMTLTRQITWTPPDYSKYLSEHLGLLRECNKSSNFGSCWSNPSSSLYTWEFKAPVIADPLSLSAPSFLPLSDQIMKQLETILFRSCPLNSRSLAVCRCGDAHTSGVRLGQCAVYNKDKCTFTCSLPQGIKSVCQHKTEVLFLNYQLV